MNFRNKIINNLAVVVLLIMTIKLWVTVLINGYSPNWSPIVATVLLLVNIALILLNKKAATLLTITILLLAAYNYIAFSFRVVLNSYFMTVGDTELSTPNINWFMFFLLIAHIALNRKYLVHLILGTRKPD